MRLIDADKIIYMWLKDQDGEEHDGVTLQSIIDKMPTVEPVIRCKQCKYYGNILFRNTGFEYGECELNRKPEVTPEHYCSWAERRTD